MAVELIKDSFKMLQMTEKETVQILLEEDILVPDIKPDLSKIVAIDGKIKISDKEISNESTRISGKIDLKIMYAPTTSTEEFPLVPMTAIVNFKHELDYPASNYSEVEVTGNVEHIDYEIINERKLKIKTVANIAAKGYNGVEVDLFTSEDDQEIQFLKRNAKYADIVERKKAPLEIKEELSIKEGMPEIGKILDWDVRIIENQSQIVNNRAVINATIQYSIVYLSEEIETVPTLFREKSEFTQFIDLANVEGDEESKIDFTLNQSNITVKQDEEENATLFDVSMDIMTNMEISKTKEKEIIVDAYHPKKEIEVQKDMINCKNMYGKSMADIPIRETLTIPDAFPGIEKIINVTAKVFETESTIEKGKDLIEGILSVNVLYLSNEKKVYGFSDEVPFRHVMEISGITLENEIEREIYIKNIEFESVNLQQIEINADVYMKSIAYKKNTYEVLTDVVILDEMTSTENGPSIILYIAKKGDNLWKIAKDYHTTIEEIKSINSILEESEIRPGEKLILLKNCQ